MQYSFLAGLSVLMGCGEIERNNFHKGFLVTEEMIQVNLCDLEQDFKNLQYCYYCFKRSHGKIAKQKLAHDS